MPQIVPAGQLNVASLSVDDFYVVVINPPSFIRGVPTDVFGIVGTASWGPVNVPVHLGSGQDSVLNFGPVGPAALNDPFDLATDLSIAFSQSRSQSSIEGWAVRVTDGTDVVASGNLVGAVTAPAKIITVAGTITPGDTCTITITDAAVTGSPLAFPYVVQAGDTVAKIAAALGALINANAAIQAANVEAAVVGAVVTLYFPAAQTLTVAGSSTGTETLTAGTAAATNVGGILQALYTGSGGNGISVAVTAGTVTNSFNVTIYPPYGGIPEVFRNIPQTNFWTTLKAAINLGQNTIRGPSQTIKALAVIPGVGAPTIATAAFAGGTDGRAVSTSALLGSASATPPTGLWSLQDVTPALGVAWVVGLIDRTADATLLNFGLISGCSTLPLIPTGTTTTASVAIVQAAGISDPSVAYMKDWVYWFDINNNVLRLVPPTAFIGGTICTRTPEESPGNKPVSLVVGTERNNPLTGNIPYSVSELAQLENAGIMLITNPIPRGNMFGIRHGQTTAATSSPVTAPFEYWRMTMYLARSLAAFGGQFVDELQSQQPNDPLRAQIRLALNQFLKFLAGLGQIDGYLVTCAFSASPNAQPGLGMNTPDSIARHYLFALVQVTYLSSVRFFVLSLQGGTTVVTVNESLQQAQLGS